MAWKKATIQLDNGAWADAQVPEIVSASRSTDIPAFYADWFFLRLEKGYSAWTNPFNGKKIYVSYQNTRFIVFWSKNPEKLIPHLDKLEQHIPKIKCYVQYTLNDYVAEWLEKGVPSVERRIDTFKRLVDKLGKGHVIWRYDPLILTDQISMDDLLHKIEYIGNQLKGYTEKLVFSFADIESYKKVKNNLIRNNVHYQEWTQEQMIEFAKRLSALNKANGWNYELATCGEKPEYKEYGIQPNHCVDDTLMIRFAWRDEDLMKKLGVEIQAKNPNPNLFDELEVIPENAIMLDDGVHYAIKMKDNKDKGQRALCGCMVSKDIGQYDTCPHQCEYCYANTSKELALANYKEARESGFQCETITGR